MEQLRPASADAGGAQRHCAKSASEYACSPSTNAANRLMPVAKVSTLPSTDTSLDCKNNPFSRSLKLIAQPREEQPT